MEINITINFDGNNYELSDLLMEYKYIKARAEIIIRDSERLNTGNLAHHRHAITSAANTILEKYNKLDPIISQVVKKLNSL